MTSAAQNNLNFATGLQSTGFTPYSGQQVAAFNPQQTQSFNMGTGIAGAVSPTLQLAGTGFENYMNGAGSQPTVNAESISSQMSPYMNQYVAQALAPQINNLNNQEALQSQLTQGTATSAGAFGDPRATMLQQNQNAANSLQEQGLVGSAYTSAFNTAIGAGAQDVANNLNAQTTNASLYNTGLGEQLTGANAILGANTGATNLENTLGAQQTAQSQAGLNANYNQWLLAQQYPFQTTQLVNSALGAGVAGAPTTTTGNSTQTAPNNAGYGLLGSALGAAGTAASGYFSGAGSSALASALMLSDERTKTEIEPVGKLHDGQNVYRFRYKWDDPKTKRIGLIAQEVEKKHPEAVRENKEGVKFVDYDKATKHANDGLSRALGIAA